MIEQSKSIKELVKSDSVKKRFEEIMGEKSTGFLVSLMSVVNSNSAFDDVDPITILSAASVAAVLDLPINSNLGFAHIIPYKKAAQFQLGYKGFIQLAQRSGQFKTISACPVYEGQIVSADPLKGYVFDWTVKSDKIIGYVSYFELLNGFEHYLYMTNEELRAHGVKYSQTFKKGYGLWTDNFDAMAIKTVLKLLLARYAPLSVDMQKAVISDQAVLRGDDIEYVDNTERKPELEDVAAGKEKARILEFIRAADSHEKLQALRVFVKDEELESAWKSQEDKIISAQLAKGEKK